MKLFSRVAVQNNYPEDSCRYGTIVGQASYCKKPKADSSTQLNELRSRFIVELDEGFYSKDEKSFVSLLVVHEDNLTVLE